MKLAPMWEKQKEAYRFGLKRGTNGTGFLMEMGCIAGDALIQVNRGGNGRRYSLAELYAKFNGLSIHPWDSTISTYAKAFVDGELCQHLVKEVLYKGKKPIVELLLASGKKLRLTADHEVLTHVEGIYVAVENLRPGDAVLTNGIFVSSCIDCGRPLSYKHKPTKFSGRCCSCAVKLRLKGVDRTGKNNPNWKGGVGFIDNDGYRRITGQQGHHREQGKSGQVYEHILVMEKELGRPIEKQEQVHHKNGLRHDNRVENLEVLSISEHQGQRHACHLRLHDTQERVKFLPKEDKVVSVRSAGFADVYDIVMDDPHRNFVANGIIVHNCGKSRVGIKLLEKWMAEENVKLVLIVNILTGLYVWPEEWNQWATYPVTFIDLHETGVEGLKTAVKLSRGGYPVICLINYEATWRLGYKYIDRIREKKPVKILEPVDVTLHDIEWDAVFLDESTAIRSPSAKTTKFLLTKVKPKAKRRVIFTGSAYTKRPLDLYAQLKFILPEGSTLFPPNSTLFKARYSIPHPYIRGAVLGYQNIPDLVERLSKCCVMLKKSDVLDLPPAVHLHPRLIELPPKVRKIYDEVTEELYTELEGYEAGGGRVTVNHIFSVMRKQAQITSGFIKMDAEGEEAAKIVELHDLKTKETIEILENRGGKPTIIVTQADYEEFMLARELKKHFGFKPKVLNGSVVGAEARHKMVREAAHDPYFIVKEAVGAKSVDMRWADFTLWFSHRPHTIDYDQMMSRNHRGGQTETITYGHLICRNTVDQRIMKLLQKDLDTAKELEDNWRALLK